MTSLTYSQGAIVFLLNGLFLMCLSFAAQDESCSPYFQKTLLQGGELCATGSLVLFGLSLWNDVVRFIEFIRKLNWKREFRNVRVTTWLLFVGSIASWFAPQKRKHLDIVITSVLIVILVFQLWFDHRRRSRDGRN